MNRRNFIRTSLAGAALAVLAIAVSPAFAAENLQRVSGGDPHLLASPQNWHVTNGAMETVWPGSYVRLRFNGTELEIGVDPTGLTAFPTVFYQVDAGEPVNVRLTAEQKAIRIEKLAAGDHELMLIYQAKGNCRQDNTWGDAQKLRLTHFQAGGGSGVLEPPAARPKRAIIYGDSITEGLSIGGVGNAAQWSYANHLMNAMDAEFDQAGIGGGAWGWAGVGGFPPLPAHWNLKKSGVPRDVSVYDYICTNHGYNDGVTADRTDTVAKWLADVRKVNTHAAIFLIVPFSGRQRQSLTSGAAKYQRDNPADKRVFVIDLGDGFYQSVSRAYTTEGIHPNIAQGGRLAGAIAGLIQRQLLALNQGTVKSSP